MDFTCSVFEKENIENQTAYNESSKLIFSKPLVLLNGKTVAQWIGRGGDEMKAREAIHDFISEAKKIQNREFEERTIIARVFSSGR